MMKEIRQALSIARVGALSVLLSHLNLCKHNQIEQHKLNTLPRVYVAPVSDLKKKHFFPFVTLCI